MIRVCDIMKHVPSISESCGVGDAHQLLRREQAHCLIVQAGNIAKGVIDPGAVSGYATTRLIADCPLCPSVLVSPVASLSEAAKSMEQGRAEYILAGDPAVPAPGIVTRSEILLELSAQADRLAEERGKYLETLEERIRLNQLLMDSLPHFAMLVLHDQSILTANRIARNMGAKPGSCCRPAFGQAVFGKENGNGRCAFCRAEEALERQDTLCSGSVDIEGRTMDVYWVPLDDQTYLHYGIDVTDRRRMEASLRQAEKMEAVGQLAGGVAHDFNNMLAGIQGYADMIATNAAQDEIKRYAARILQAAKRSADLTKQLLAFARKGKYRSIPVDMHELINDVLNLLERSINKRIRLCRALNSPRHIVIGEPAQLQNALLNLGLNARDAMPDGGELQYQTQAICLRESEAAAISPELEAGEYLRIHVCDSGCGMPEEILKHIFEPFFTTKDVGKGTGLGLSSAYGTVRNHQGEITVRSEPGAGTTFTVYLPLCPDLPTRQERPATTEERRGEEHILIVDDEELLRGVLKTLLRSMGYRVTASSGGRDAVEVYRRDPGKFDLIILDLMMPDMDGKTTFAALRSVNPQVRVIFASGYSIGDEVPDVTANNACWFVQKPFDRTELAATLAEAFRPSATAPE